MNGGNIEKVLVALKNRINAKKNLHNFVAPNQRQIKKTLLFAASIKSNKTVKFP